MANPTSHPSAAATAHTDLSKVTLAEIGQAADIAARFGEFNTALASIHERFGITEGDGAGSFFSGGRVHVWRAWSHERRVREMTDYMRFEQACAAPETGGKPYAKKVELNNNLKLYVASMGKIFRVGCVANYMAEANEFCRKNRGYGVIGEDGAGRIYCADLHGAKCPSKLLEDV